MCINISEVLSTKSWNISAPVTTITTKASEQTDLAASTEIFFYIYRYTQYNHITNAVYENGIHQNIISYPPNLGSQSVSESYLRCR